MIEITMSGDQLTVRHYATRPIVYLDHWALMDIADQFADRFVSALLAREGTLALSWVNFVEISATSGVTSDNLTALLRRVFPHVIFLDTEAVSVISKENEFINQTRRGAPFLHGVWLDVFLGWKRTRSLNPLDPDEFLEAFKSPQLRGSLKETVERGKAEMAEMLTAARDKMRRDAEARKRIASPLPMGDPRVPPTRFVFEQALKYLLRGNQNLDNENHLQDLFHMVVPISYCRYVVLDKNWREASRQIQSALMRRKLLTHEARVCDDVPEFLWHLENEKDYRR